MAGEWRTTTWGDEISLEYGKTLRDYNLNHGAYRVFGSNGAIGWTDESLALGPGVILGRKGAYRGLEFSRDPFWVIDTAYYAVPKKPTDMRWLYYAMRHHKLGEIDDGSPIPSTTRAAVYVRELDVPSAPEQRAIAHILGTLDDKIELNRRMSETLEAMARALFKSWFVDFDPVRAKTQGRWQRGQSLPGLPAHLYDIFPDRLVDSELGEIPEGWGTGSFGDLATQSKDSVNPSESPDACFSHFSLPAFDEGQAPKRELGETIKSNKWRVPPDSVLLSKLNPEIDRTWLVDVGDGDNAICSTEFLVLVPKMLFTRAYIYCLARSQSFRQRIESLVTGTSKSHQRAQAAAAFGLEAVLPPQSIVQAFDRIAENALARTLVQKRECHTLAALRDTLLPKLISGELRVSGAIHELEIAS